MVSSIDRENTASPETSKTSFEDFTKKIRNFIIQLFKGKKKKLTESVSKEKSEHKGAKHPDSIMDVDEEFFGSDWC